VETFANISEFTRESVVVSGSDSNPPSALTAPACTAPVNVNPVRVRAEFLTDNVPREPAFGTEKETPLFTKSRAENVNKSVLVKLRDVPVKVATPVELTTTLGITEEHVQTAPSSLNAPVESISNEDRASPQPILAPPSNTIFVY
jgi:hypothetical protein